MLFSLFVTHLSLFSISLSLACTEEHLLMLEKILSCSQNTSLSMNHIPLSCTILFLYACFLCWDLRSITFWNFDQNIKCSGKYWIRHSKYQATKNRWSYHLVWMRKHTYRVSLKEFLKLFKCLASSIIQMVSRWLDLLFKALHQERKRRMESFHKACMGTLSCGRSPPIYRHLVWGFFIKTLIIMYISTNIHKTYMSDPLGAYISLVNTL